MAERTSPGSLTISAPAQAASGGPPVVARGTFGAEASLLLENGYAPIPVRPESKVPAVTRWSQVDVSESKVADWAIRYSSHSIGLRTGALVGIDIDLTDPDAAYEVATAALSRFGTTLVRVGAWPKRLLLFRTDEPFAKLKRGCVEVLGLGQQFVAFGGHPDTGRPYTWPMGETPLEVPLGELPPVTRASIDAFLAGIDDRPMWPRVQALAPLNHKRPTKQAGSGEIVRDPGGKVIDGRDAWLSSIAYHAVWDASEQDHAHDQTVLAHQVYERFAASTDLSRPRGAGSGRYDLRQASRKVGDKLRLLAQGRLPSRSLPDVDAGYSAPELTAEQARAGLAAEFETFASSVRDWLVGGQEGDPPKLAIRATVGLGKSTLCRERLSLLQQHLKAAGLPYRIVIFVPNHRLADEVAASWQDAGAHVAVVRGYEHISPGGQPMCRNRKAVRVALANRMDVQSAACMRSATLRCRVFDGCAKQANRREVANADVVIAPHTAMFQRLAGATEDVALTVVDEGCWASARTSIKGLTLRGIEAGNIGSGARRGTPVSRAGDAADLHALRGSLAAAIRRSGTGPLEKSACLEAGLTSETCRDALDLEERRLKPRRATAGEGPARLTAIANDATWNAGVHEQMDLWRCVLSLMEGPAATSTRFLIGAANSDTGDRALSVSRLRAMDACFARLPCLHLDATYRPELATPVLGPMKEVAFEARTPHMSVTLVHGRFGKARLAKGLDVDGQIGRDLDEGSVLAECRDYVRLVATKYTGRQVLVVTYKQIESVFAGIEGVTTGHFNAVAGIDRWKDCAALVVIGRPLPRDRDLPALAGVHLGRVVGDRYGERRVGVLTADGQNQTIRSVRHPDPEGDILRAAICDDQLIQVIGRGRGVNRTSSNPLDVHVLADTALPLVHDRVTCWEVEAPGIFERMLLWGVAVDSSADAYRLHPELFTSVEQAKTALRRSPLKDQVPYEKAKGLTLETMRYRKAGRGQSWQTAWWIAGSRVDVKDRLGETLGEIAGWETIQA